MCNSPTKLIVGLGNPGEKYAKTRHNAGFLFIDALCQQVAASLKPDKHGRGRSAKTVIAGHDIRLLAPDTFMNLSGNAVVAAAQYYRIELSEMIIVHDELDLDAGIARLKLNGGSGGNKGLRDIIQKTGSGDFARLRIGIGRPDPGRDLSGYVLKAPNQNDKAKIDNAIIESLRVINLIAVGDFALAMNQLHTNLAQVHT